MFLPVQWKNPAAARIVHQNIPVIVFIIRIISQENNQRYFVLPEYMAVLSAIRYLSCIRAISFCRLQDINRIIHFDGDILEDAQRFETRDHPSHV